MTHSHHRLKEAIDNLEYASLTFCDGREHANAVAVQGYEGTGAF